MDIGMPDSFPADEFRAFGIAAQSFFLPILSEENLNDPLEKRRHFEWSWQAVRYRYRTCADTADEFRTLLTDTTDAWQGGLAVDEELTYRLERCIYLFFISALSVFESFGFCVYFLGSALEQANFPYFSNPKKITLAVTSTAFAKSFPSTEITSQLAELLRAPEYANIDALRNILVHRVSGRRSVRGHSTTNADGTIWHSTEESWHIPGSSEVLMFDEEMLNRYLHKLTTRIHSLVSAARKFAQNCQSTGGWPR